MLDRFLALLLLFIVAPMCEQAAAQATVVGGQGTYIYVDGQTGSNSYPGSATEPFKTIQAGINKAVANSKAGKATVVSINSGVYRESVLMSAWGTSATITIQASTPGTVYIDGADILTNGNQIGSGAYAFPWTDSVGGCPLPAQWIPGQPPIELANEMVFVNGALLTQVMSSSQLVPGTFFVDKTNQMVDVDPPTGTDISTAEVEVSARRATLTIDDATNVVVRGLVFQHAASCMNVGGAETNNSSNILFDQVQANWNNWIGMGINGSQHVTVQNSTTSYNGGLGFMGFEIVNGLFLNNEADYNNWRGEMVGFYDYGQGGFKFGHNRSITVNGQHSYNNQGEGLWFDTDNANITVENSVLVGSATENLKFEANEGPFTVTGNTLCSGGVGVILMDSAGVTLSNNFLYDNQSTGMDATYGNLTTTQNAQVYLAGAPGGRTYPNFQTGASVTTQNTNITFQDNTIVDAGSGQYVFNTYLSGYPWTDFLDTFHSSGNKWYDAAKTNAFRTPGGETKDLPGWRSLTAQDGTSEWTSVSQSSVCQVPSPAYPDFAVLARNAVNYIDSYSMSKGTLSIPLQVKSFGFGSVQLSAPGLPTGVAASFSPSTLVSGDSDITLTAYSNATAQKSAVTIFATSGNRVHTLTLWVNIVPGTQTQPAGKTTPTIIWPEPAAITYGTPLSSTQLDATASVAGTFSYSPAAGTVEPVGTDTLSVTFTPTNTTAYNTATASVSLVVNTASKITPTISWASPAAITYGTPLSSTQLDATASVAGTFSYSPAAGTVEPVGTDTLSVTFTPTNTTAYNTATASVALVVKASKTTPTITWPTPATITYGTALSATQLDATASVAGTFSYSPAAGTVEPVGTDTLSVTFTPTNTTAYNTATASVSLVVKAASKTTPTITWPAPAAITYGTSLSATQLDATASVAGTFSYSPAAGTVEPVGTDTLSVTFTPTNTTAYNTATASVSLVVNAASKTTPTITWATPAAITYGTPLSATQLDATASVAGTFSYSPAAGTVEPVGTDTLSVTFTPTNTTAYNTATASVSLVVKAASKTTPTITWATPAAITHGTPLSSTQLDATASVAGKFSYSPAAGTVLPVGTNSLSVTFTPSNSNKYNTAIATVSLVVNAAPAPSPAATPAISATPSELVVNKPGSSTSSTLTIANFSGSSIQISCSGLPKESTCSFGKLSGSNKAGSVALKITTTAASNSSTAQLTPLSRRSGPQIVFALTLPGLVAVFALFTTRRRYAQWTLSLLLVISASFYLSGCGTNFSAPKSLAAQDSGGSGGPASGGSGSSGSSNPGTPQGTSTVTITAVSGTDSATATITFTVQ